MDSHTYLTPREAAQYLRTSTSTLAKRRLYNGLPKFCRIGRAIRYRKLDLDEFMAKTRGRHNTGSDEHE
jgi:excisionase family DNA binding protein